jgi:hypothetical protein
MVQILHGEHTAQSRAQLGLFLDAARHAGQRVDRFLGKQLTLSELQLAIERQTLFAQPRLIVIEDLLSTTASKKKEALLEFVKNSLPQLAENGDDLILWEGKQLTAKQTPTWPGAKVTSFKLSQNLFAWLESWKGTWLPAERVQFLQKTQAVMTQEGADFCLIMLQRQLRFWLEVHLGLPPAVPPFAIKKISTQAKTFTMPQLQKLHQRLTTYDQKQKRGGNLLTTTQELELLVLTL